LLLYSHTISPRLQYITDFIGKEIFGKPLEITADKEIFIQSAAPKINYSKEKISETEYWIQPHSLVFEKGIKQQTVKCFDINGQKAFFKIEGDFPFDIFAACFYLLSRYEEYMPHEKDMYGRFAYENSLAFKKGFLHLPLINLWLQSFKESLKQKFTQLTIRHSLFTFLPTYDIDEAFSYKYKQWWRTTGATIKSVIRGQWSAVDERIKVLRGIKKDPFDSYNWMDQLHRQYNLKPYYFFLVARKTGKYDKNILPSKKAMQDLIRRHSNHYTIGIHPSWQSGDDADKLKFEILKLGHITGKQVLSSRQHFIRFTLPYTYRQLIDLGIESDFSMGYGSINGFRASVASPFYWYDLAKEEQTKLLLYPFCFMDANSFFEQRFSSQQALDEMRQYYNIVKSVNGMFISIWHNTFLGTSELFAGWRDVYEQFIKEIS
jgi:hypothetical protein